MSCSAVAIASTVEPVTVKWKRCLKETSKHQSSKSLKLEDLVPATDGQDIVKAGCSEQKRGKKNEVKRQLVRQRRHRNGHWSGLSMTCGESAWQGKSSPIPRVHVKQQTGAGAASLRPGTIFNRMDRFDLETTGNESDVGDVFQPIFWVGGEAPALLLLFALLTVNGSGECMSSGAVGEVGEI